MYLMIDNYDSFVYNLRAYFEEAGHEILVVENDGITTCQIRQMKPEGIIISPGPKTPEDAGISAEVIRSLQVRSRSLASVSVIRRSATWQVRL